MSLADQRPTLEDTQSLEKEIKAKLSFRSKLTLLSSALTLLPMLVVGPIVIERSATTMETMSRELRIAVAGDIARTVDSEFSEAQNGLDAVSKMLTDPTLGETLIIELATTLVAANEILDHVSIYRKDGSLIDTIREEGVGHISQNMLSQINSTLLEDALEQGIATGMGAIWPNESMIRVPLLLPITSEEQHTGFVLSHVSLERISERVIERAAGHFEGLKDSLFLLDEKHRILAHSDPSLSHTLASYHNQGILEAYRDSDFRKPIPLSSEYVHKGHRMVGSLMPITSRNWAVISQLPRNVAYASVITVRNVVFVSLFVALMVALLAAYLMSKRITQPIEKLTQFAHDLAHRRFDKRVSIQTNDELSILGDVMSAAAQDLQQSETRIRNEVAIRTDLGRYLPTKIVDKVIRREQDMNLGGQRTEISVLFADVVAFTPMTDQLEPQQVVALLNELFSILTEIVFKHGGTVDKFVGDCVMAIWGAPERAEDHADRAIAAAEDMINWLETSNPGWQRKYGTQVRLAIGINSGPTIVGNIGSDTRMEYTAIGDVVNVASRLEAIARPQQVLITKATHDAASDMFEFIDRGPRELAGRNESIHLYELRQ